jgi:hypothetical protein
MGVAERFYEAFAIRDWHTMGRCYAPSATFSDPVFPQLDVDGVRAMWEMLLTRGQDLTCSATVEESENHARAVWIARYTFTSTGRFVVNRVTTEMTIAAGRIVRQVDHFSFWNWSRQALGLPGLLLGWSPIVKNKVRAQAAHSLRQFMARNAR